MSTYVLFVVVVVVVGLQPAMTTRGLKEEHFTAIAELLDRAVKLCAKVQEVSGPMLKAFIPAMKEDADVAALKTDVAAFARGFAMPGARVGM